MQHSNSTRMLPSALQGVAPAALEEYVQSRISSFMDSVVQRLLALEPQLSISSIQRAITEAAALQLPPPAMLQPAMPEVQKMVYQLVFRHDCLALGCLDPQCTLCQHNPQRRCTVNFDRKYLVNDVLKAKCGAQIRVELTDANTGALIEPELPGLKLEVCVLDGHAYDTKFVEGGGRALENGQEPEEELEACVLLLNKKKNTPLLVSGSTAVNDTQGRLVLQLQHGRAVLPDVAITDSSEAILLGRKPPFRLLVRAIWSTPAGAPNMAGSSGRPGSVGPPGVIIRHAISEGFVVATRRTRTAGKVDIPSVDDPVSKLEHMGKETVKKLADIRAAAIQAGIDIIIPENTVTKVGEFKLLALRADQDGHLRQRLQHVLKLSKEKWDEAREHALRAVVADARFRAWYADPHTCAVGLLFACRLGSVDLDRPQALIQMVPVSGAGNSSGAGAMRMEATVMAQLTPAQRDLVRQILPRAAHSWWGLGHPGWAIFTPPPDADSVLLNVLSTLSAQLDGGSTGPAPPPALPMPPPPSSMNMPMPGGGNMPVTLRTSSGGLGPMPGGVIPSMLNLAGSGTGPGPNSMPPALPLCLPNHFLNQPPNQFPSQLPIQQPNHHQLPNFLPGSLPGQMPALTSASLLQNHNPAATRHTPTGSQAGLHTGGRVSINPFGNVARIHTDLGAASHQHTPGHSTAPLSGGTGPGSPTSGLQRPSSSGMSGGPASSHLTKRSAQEMNTSSVMQGGEYEGHTRARTASAMSAPTPAVTAMSTGATLSGPAHTQQHQRQRSSGSVVDQEAQGGIAPPVLQHQGGISIMPQQHGGLGGMSQQQLGLGGLPQQQLGISLQGLTVPPLQQGPGMSLQGMHVGGNIAVPPPNRQDSSSTVSAAYPGVSVGADGLMLPGMQRQHSQPTPSLMRASSPLPGMTVGPADGVPPMQQLPTQPRISVGTSPSPVKLEPPNPFASIAAAANVVATDERSQTPSNADLSVSNGGNQAGLMMPPPPPVPYNNLQRQQQQQGVQQTGQQTGQNLANVPPSFDLGALPSLPSQSQALQHMLGQMRAGQAHAFGMGGSTAATAAAALASSSGATDVLKGLPSFGVSSFLNSTELDAMLSTLGGNGSTGAAGTGLPDHMETSLTSLNMVNSLQGLLGAGSLLGPGGASWLPQQLFGGANQPQLQQGQPGQAAAGQAAGSAALRGMPGAWLGANRDGAPANQPGGPAPGSRVAELAGGAGDMLAGTSSGLDNMQSIEQALPDISPDMTAAMLTAAQQSSQWHHRQHAAAGGPSSS